MNYQNYLQATGQAAQLVERGDYEAAITILQELLSSDISEVDKAMLCFNLAVIHDKMGQETEAVAWYDKGAAYESGHGRYYVAERKAIYLAEKGHIEKSLHQYQALHDRPELTEADKARIAQNIAVLQRQMDQAT